MTGGPPVRGTKLLAWRVPKIWNDLETGKLNAPENSKVLARQKRLGEQTKATLKEIYADVREGLMETVGVDCALVVGEKCSVKLDLPETADTEKIARAIDLENIEAWRDTEGKVHVAINPWYSTKDVDQTVLCAVKVIHVLLGIHASDTEKPKSFKQKLLASIAEVMQIQQQNEDKK
ncbi:MAG: hypothetical protein ACR2N3_15665 [Pyrinomonadaceae bacterium]